MTNPFYGMPLQGIMEVVVIIYDWILIVVINRQGIHYIKKTVICRLGGP